MNKKVLLVLALCAAGGAGFAFAQNTKPAGTVAKQAAVKKVARSRIIKLNDRIKNQRERIDQGLTENTLTMAQAKACRDVLSSVDDKMKAEHKANGTKKTMKKEQYDAYNSSLDANSQCINEDKQYFYYYGPYADYGPYYNYYYDAYPGSGAPVTDVSALEKAHPRIFELNARIKSQQDRIDQGVKENTLTQDQATSCREVLNTVEKQMKSDYKANGSKKSMILTKDQYTAFNTSLDANSAFIHEQKQYFYYYGPYSNRYYF
jgi:regulator of replication initiation timing